MKLSLILKEILSENIPNTLYHVTTLDNLNSIIRNGLVPNIGDRSKKLGETESRIYFFGSLDDVNDALMNWLLDEFSEDTKLVLLQVKIPNDVSITKEDDQFEYSTKDRIDSKYIKILSKDLGEEVDIFQLKEVKDSKNNVDLFIKKYNPPVNTESYIVNIFNRFNKVQDKLKNKDIFKYPSLLSLTTAINHAEEIGSHSQHIKDISNNQVVKILDNNECIVLMPLTRDAVIKYSKGTKWCISSKHTSIDYYNYTRDNRIYIIIDKEYPDLKYCYVVPKDNDPEYLCLYDSGDNEITGEKMEEMLHDWGITDELVGLKRKNESINESINIPKNCEYKRNSDGSISFYRNNKLTNSFDNESEFEKVWDEFLHAQVCARNSMENHGGTNGFSKSKNSIKKLKEVVDMPPQYIQPSNDLVSIESENEGTKHFRYKDSKGHWTVGIGFNLEQPLAKKCFLNAGISEKDFNDIKNGYKGLTDKGMYKVFKQYEKEFYSDLKRFIPNYDALPSQAQLVCFDLIYNTGTQGFLQFKKFINALKNNDFVSAKKEFVKSLLPRTDRFKRNVELLDKLS